MGWITSFWFVLVRFELLQILIQSIDKYLISMPMNIHTKGLKIKKQNFTFGSLFTYLILSVVFRTHSRVSNDCTVTIICMYVCILFLFGLYVPLQHL